MPDGRVLHGTVLSSVLKVFPEVACWQARQPAPDLLRILVVPTPPWSDRSAEAIEKKLAERRSFRMSPIRRRLLHQLLDPRSDLFP